MTGGVVVCLYVLLSVFEHIGAQVSLHSLSDAQLVDRLCPFGKIVGEFFANRTLAESAAIRRRYGTGGRTQTLRQVQAAIREAVPEFAPEGLEKWIASRADERMGDAYAIILSVERRLQVRVVEMLQDRFGADHRDWWTHVPQQVRLEAVKRREEHNRDRGDEEERYMDLIDYRRIMPAHWQDAFQSTFAYGTSGNKEKRTDWLVKLNGIRNRVMHPSSGGLSTDELQYLEEIDRWLADQGV